MYIAQDGEFTIVLFWMAHSSNAHMGMTLVTACVEKLSAQRQAARPSHPMAVKM